MSSVLYGLRAETLLPQLPFRVGLPQQDWLGRNDLDSVALLQSPIPSRGELFFIDAEIADPNAFWLVAPKGATIMCIPEGVDAWHFMAQEAEQFRELGAIHIISHGEPGAVVLNGRRYTGNDFGNYSAQLHQLGRALSKNGDILLYGCDTGAGHNGAMLVTRLAEFTGADVAASLNRTGALSSADWNLELTTGRIESTVLAPEDYRHQLATITVTSNANSGAGTLRQAIADATAGDTITFNAGMTIVLSSQLTISKNLTIDGDLNNDDTPDVTLDANYNDRVLSITTGTVVLDGLVITKGRLSGNGGGFGSLAGGSSLGAGISVTGGTVTIGHSTISSNVAAGGGGGGSGGTYSYGGGGGGGFSGKGGGNGGAYNGGISGATGSGGTGGIGGYSTTSAQAGKGGSTTGGAGGSVAGGFVAGGNGATAGTIGGGGGGAGASGGATGGIGGAAAGGMHIAAGATVNMFATTVSGNLAAGGGGGGGYVTAGGAGGQGVGGILNAGTLNYQNSTMTFSSNTGAGGAGGGSTGISGSAGASVNNLTGGTLNSSWSPPDTTPPTVSGVTSSTADGSYNAGDAISIQVNFSEAVTVTGTPQLTLETGTTDRAVNYASGSGTSTLTFTYTVQAGDTSADLDYVGTTSLALNSGTISDAAGNVATLTLATPGASNSLGANKNLVVDGVAPTVSGVTSSTANGSYNAGDAISIQVNFSEAVTVTGTPQLTLETGTTDRTVNYASGSGTSTLTFTYTVQAGDTSADLDYVGTTSLALNSGTINDAAGNAATLTLATPGASNSLGANKNLVIDTTAPTVTGVTSSTANGSYNAGDAISIQVNFSEAVTVTGTPQLTLETGTTDRTVNYASGSGTSTLTFTYTVQAGDTSADLDYVGTTSLALNSGTINDAAGNAATLTLATPGASNSLGANKNLVIDTTAPTVSGVTSSTANGTYKAGDSISIQVNFSEAVTVTGTPQLTLETGTTDRTVNYASGSGTSTLTFTYTVQAGDTSSDLDYVGTTSLALNSGTINDAAGNAATLTLATPGASNSLGANKNLVVDGVAPTVSGVTSSTANGSYNAGDAISIQVNFSEAVTVTGTPQLTLETGTTDRTVNYASGTGTSTLTFTYTVQAGDTSADLDYVGTTSLALNSGTINDATGNAATLTLATPGASDSLGANKNLVIDTTAPTITDANIAISGASGTSGAFKIGDTVTATWNNTGTGDNNADVAGVTANFSQFGGGAAVAASNSAGTWTATYLIAAGSIDATNRNVSVTATDNAGNATTTADTTNATVDNQAATVTAGNIAISGASGTSGAFRIGDTVTATWDNTSTGDNNADTISNVTVDFSQFGGGAAVAASNNSDTWTATFMIVSGSIDASNRNVSVTATDNAGNATTTADTANATVDNIPLAVTDANVAISGASGTSGAFKIGDTVTATWANTAGGDNNGDTVSSVTMDFTQFGGGAAVAASNSSSTWTATYVIVAGSIDTTNRNVSVTATDNVGNATSRADTTNATVDNTAPTLTAANISISGGSGTSGAFKIGDTITATWNNTGTGDNNADTISGVTVNFTQFGGGAAVAASNSSGTWTATYVIVGGSIDATNRNVSVTATDNAGNATTTADDTNATVDNQVPTVTAGNITISGASGTSGAFKTGDTITATWDNTGTGDNNSDIASVTVDFTAFGGGAAVAATNSSNTWTATYTFAAGTLDATNLNVSVTATDNAGGATTTADTANATADNQAPTVTDGRISISGASGTSGAFKVGDTVTATWNNTGTGDNNADTISGVTVDFTQFGGGATVVASNSSGTWTATYLIAAGSIDAINRNVSVTATDNAGNTTTTADTTNATVDSTVPATPSAPNLDAASDTGTSDTDNITTDTTPTFSGIAEAGSTVTLLEGSTVLGTATATGGNWTITSSALTAGAHTLKVNAKDAANNTSADSATLIVTVDTAAPTLNIIARQTPVTVNTHTAAVTWRVTFDGGVSGVDTSDFALTLSGGSASGTIASVTSVSTTVYDVAVNSLSGQGRLRLDLKASGTGIADLAGNALAAGGFTNGDFYLVGVTNVFDTTMLAADAGRTQTISTANGAAQRFTTAASAPLSLTTVTAALGAVSGTALEVRLFSDDAGDVGDPIATLTLAGTLTANSLNVWTSTQLLTANTTYWIVFTATAGIYEIKATASGTNSGGVGDWLTGNYVYRHGAVGENSEIGALLLALGATSTPTITSTLTASGTYGAAFTYNITGTNLPTSYGATGLPAGLTLTAGTGAITGSPTQTGTFNVSLTGINGSGTGTPSTLVLTVGPALLTVTPNSVSRAFGVANPVFTVGYNGFVNGDGPSSLTTQPTATSAATLTSPVGTYAITASGGVSANYTFNYVAGVLTVTPAPQVITFATIGELILGDSITLAPTASSGLPVSLAVVSGPATISSGVLATTGVGSVTVRASQVGGGNFAAATPVDRTFLVTVGPAAVTTPTQVPTPPAGGDVQLTVVESNPNVVYQWQRNGTDLDGATGPTLTLDDVQPPTAGLYTYTAMVPGGGDGGTSEPVIVGLSTTEKVVGTGEEVGADIQHPNGNTYDQVLLEGPATTVTANTNQITRISFIDLSNDIVQVEFSGAGTLSLVMDNASTPAPATNYNQPGVDYVKGHAGLVITGANETSNLSVISVGGITAVNQALFLDNVSYDGIADIAFVAIQSTNGKFGGIRTGNVNYFATQGFTGVYAPGVELTGPMNIGDISAFDTATPLLVVGAVSDARITGGSLFQANSQPVTVSGITQLKFVVGTTSHGVSLPAQANQAVLIQDGVDVTSQIVVNP